MRVLPVMLLLLMLACAATRPNVPSAVAEREILDLERAWDDAEVHRDAVALNEILDDRFVFTWGAEGPVDKATVIKNILANDRPSPPSTDSEQHVTLDGDVAIVTGVETVDKVVDGKPAKRASRHTSTFVHRDGRWRALAVHMVVIPPAHENDGSVEQTVDRDVLHHAMPREFGENSSVTLDEVTYPPNGSTRPHRHSCPVMAYVVDGSIRMQVKGGAEHLYQAGEAFYEDPTDVHLVSANGSSTTAAKFVAFSVCRDGPPVTLPVAPPAGSGTVQP